MHIYRQKQIRYFTLPRDDNFQVSDCVYLRKYEPLNYESFFLDDINVLTINNINFEPVTKVKDIHTCTSYMYNKVQMW